MALFSTNHTLTQGSLHYRLATLGYQKQNPYGVRLFANILCPAFPIKRDEIKKSATPTALCSMLRINPG